jgi:hypothetical protein
MVEEKTLIVKPGQRFVHKRKNTLYIVKSIKDKTVSLVSENGEATMLIQMDDLRSATFEPICN